MEFIGIICVAAVLFSVWSAFGDDAAATGAEAGAEGSEGTGDAGGSEANSEDESGGFAAAAEAAKLGKNWVEWGNRNHTAAQEGKQAKIDLEAAQAKIADLEGKASTQATQTAAQTRRDGLMAQALKQGFKRSVVTDYLDDHTLDQLDTRLEKDRDGSNDEGNDTKDKRPDKNEARIAKLEKAATTSAQNAEMQRQMGGALQEHAEGLEDEDKATIVGIVDQAVNEARASGKDLPDISASVKNLAARFKSIAERAVEKYKDDNKGTATAAGSEQPNSEFQEEVESMEPSEQAMLKAMRDA